MVGTLQPFFIMPNMIITFTLVILTLMGPKTWAALVLPLQMKQLLDQAEHKQITTMAQVSRYRAAFKAAQLPADVADLILEAVADSLVEEVMVSQALPRASESKLYYLLRENVNAAFDLPSKTLSDASVMYAATTPVIFFVIYSNKPFEGASQVKDLGLFFKKQYLGQADFIDVKNFQHQWSVDGVRYRSTTSVKYVNDARSWIKGKTSPKYNEMLSDGVLSTLVLADQTTLEKVPSGHSMAFIEFSTLLQYLLKEGFTVENPNPHEVSGYPVITDTKTFFKNKLTGSNGERPVDIFWKTAHNGGEDKLFLRLPKKLRRLRATLRRSDNVVEVFEYVFPDILAAQNDIKLYSPIMTSEIGDWIRERIKKYSSELLYINGACNSYKQVVFELPAVRTPNHTMTIIGSDIDIFFFNPSPSGALYQIIEALRQQEDYSSLRARLNLVKEAYPAKYQVKQQNKSIFILPNESAYYEEILKYALDVTMKVEKLDPDSGVWSDNPLNSTH